jgi:hypothetical protein
VPLEYPLQKFGNKKPDVDRFELTTPLGGVSEEREEFAIAQYKKLSDSDKLSAPSFERMEERSQIRNRVTPPKPGRGSRSRLITS